jgi:hypothetical protein
MGESGYFDGFKDTMLRTIIYKYESEEEYTNASFSGDYAYAP